MSHRLRSVAVYGHGEYVAMHVRGSKQDHVQPLWNGYFHGWTSCEYPMAIVEKSDGSVHLITMDCIRFHALPI